MEPQKERILYYNTIINEYHNASSIVVDKFCNGVTVINIGTSVMRANQIPLNPGTPGTNNGESWTFGGNRGEVYSGRIDLSFTGNAGSALVIQKVYIPELCSRNTLL
jgi:hypothetical protein